MVLMCTISVDLHGPFNTTIKNKTLLRRKYTVYRACGGTVVHRTDELREDDIGTECGLFEVRKIGDE